MEKKQRVPKGEKYWFINENFDLEYDYEQYALCDDSRFDLGNYFATEAEVNAMVTKLRAVLKGADVIEWHKVSEELPLVDTEVVCKMKGVPHTEHFICKWDGEFWWHWDYLGEKAQGWFGLNKGWEVTEWKKI